MWCVREVYSALDRADGSIGGGDGSIGGGCRGGLTFYRISDDGNMTAIKIHHRMHLPILIVVFLDLEHKGDIPSVFVVTPHHSTTRVSKQYRVIPIRLSCVVFDFLNGNLQTIVLFSYTFLFLCVCVCVCSPDFRTGHVRI